MHGISSRYQTEASYFNDIDALGIFVDNHDNARFLNGNNNEMRFKNALVFSLTARGIPFVYYGSEQGFKGGDDPNNREVLWTSMNTGSDLYKYI
jgi:alpha-amylase